MQSIIQKAYYFFFYFCLFVVIVVVVVVAISWAAPAAYGGSQARGLIGAVATGLRQSHSNAGSEPHRNLHHSSRQRRIVNPLSKGRDRTCNLMVPSRIR